MQPKKRRLAEKALNFVGYVLPEDIEDYQDKDKARNLLGYGSNLWFCVLLAGLRLEKTF